jgi:RecA/RadA recombinase
MKRIRTVKPIQKLSIQVEKKQKNDRDKKLEQAEYDGKNITVSTGSTLLDLAISGGRFREGGIPIGIFVEIFGPASAGKTVLLCQIAGLLQKAGGNIMFHDPEARLNLQFARMFGLVPDEIKYTIPNTIPQVFQSVRKWVPNNEEEGQTPLYGVFADSLAALSTDMEMDKEEGDKMGMRRAKEFSEELRKTCRIITQQNILMVCSNQVRQNSDAGMFGMKFKSPGGEAIGFYSSLRLRCLTPQKIKTKRTIQGKEHERIIGIKTEVEVFKSSVWKPYHTADVYILYDYGIDDIRANLQYLKGTSKDTIYMLGETKLGKSLNRAIQTIEEEGLEKELKNAVIERWNEIEKNFDERRKPREW